MTMMSCDDGAAVAAWCAVGKQQSIALWCMETQRRHGSCSLTEQQLRPLPQCASSHVMFGVAWLAARVMREWAPGFAQRHAWEPFVREHARVSVGLRFEGMRDARATTRGEQDFREGISVCRSVVLV